MGAGIVYIKMSRPAPAETERNKQEQIIAGQYENFLNYDGTARGQKEIGD